MQNWGVLRLQWALFSVGLCSLLAFSSSQSVEAWPFLGSLGYSRQQSQGNKIYYISIDLKLKRSVKGNEYDRKRRQIWQPNIIASGHT